MFLLCATLPTITYNADVIQPRDNGEVWCSCTDVVSREIAQFPLSHPSELGPEVFLPESQEKIHWVMMKPEQPTKVLVQLYGGGSDQHIFATYPSELGFAHINIFRTSIEKKLFNDHISPQQYPEQDIQKIENIFAEFLRTGIEQIDPAFKNLPLWIFGASYGGKMVLRLVEREDLISHVAGAIADSCTLPNKQSYTPKIPLYLFYGLYDLRVPYTYGEIYLERVKGTKPNIYYLSNGHALDSDPNRAYSQMVEHCTKFLDCVLNDGANADNLYSSRIVWTGQVCTDTLLEYKQISLENDIRTFKEQGGDLECLGKNESLKHVYLDAYIRSLLKTWFQKDDFIKYFSAMDLSEYKTVLFSFCAATQGIFQFETLEDKMLKHMSFCGRFQLKFMGNELISLGDLRFLDKTLIPYFDFTKTAAERFSCLPNCTLKSQQKYATTY